MAEQPNSRGWGALVGAVVANLAGAVFVVIAVIFITSWTARGMMPWASEPTGFPLWWVAPVLALIGVAMFAVGTSFTRQWRRVRTR